MQQITLTSFEFAVWMPTVWQHLDFPHICLRAGKTGTRGTLNWFDIASITRQARDIVI